MLPWCLRNKRLMSTAAHVNCSVWEVCSHYTLIMHTVIYIYILLQAVARNRSMLGQRTLLVVSGTGNDEENETNLRMQYELSKVAYTACIHSGLTIW